jgi:hypothetical protein
VPAGPTQAPAGPTSRPHIVVVADYPPIFIHHITASACKSFSSPAVPVTDVHVDEIVWALDRKNNYPSDGGYPDIPAAWNVYYSPQKTIYPAPSNFVGTIPCGTAAGTYEGYGFWRPTSGPYMGGEGPARVQVHVDVSPSPGPTPTCSAYKAACGAPPPPAIAKSIYTASLVSKPSLDFTDGADQKLGALTWNVSGDTAKFKNVKFSQPSTAAPPHSNSLTFEVDDAVVPGDYSIHVNVTSSVNSLTSLDTIVTLRVLPPVSYAGEVNAADIYEEDAQGNVVVPDGSHLVTDDDKQVPDFPFKANNLDLLNKERRAEAVGKGFNPLAPPSKVVEDLKNRVNGGRFGCNGYIAESNASDDLTSGSAQGQIRVVAYCLSGAILPSVSLFQRGANLNRPDQIADLIIYIQPCTNIGNYTVYTVCATDLRPVTPALKHAEKTTFGFTMTCFFRSQNFRRPPGEIPPSSTLTTMVCFTRKCRSVTAGQFQRCMLWRTTTSHFHEPDPSNTARRESKV